MAYSDFTTFKQIREQFGLRWQLSPKQNFIAFSPLLPSDLLREQLRDAQELPILLSEKARSEFLISPILFEVWKKYRSEITLFSGISLDVDKSLGLNGICDYLFNCRANSYEVEAPVLCLVETKNRDLIDGLAQCAAEMQAAMVLNQKSGNSLNAVFGCVTDGEVWNFLKLEEGVIHTHTQHYFLNELEHILGIFDAIFKTHIAKTSN